MVEVRQISGRWFLEDDHPGLSLSAWGEIRYVGKETDRKWEEGDEISVSEFAATGYGQKGKVVAGEDVKGADRQHWNQQMRSRKRI